MTNKKLFTLLVTAFAVIGLASAAFAANNCEMSSDKPNIPYSTCEQAGAITLNFDNQTQIHEGDNITLTLSQNVSVCGNIDYFLFLADEGGEGLTSLSTDPVISTTGSASNDDIDTFYNGGLVADAAVITDGVDNYAVGFLVQAVDGSRFINITLARRYLTSVAGPPVGTVVVDDTTDLEITFDPDDTNDQLIIKIFDEKSQPVFFFEEGDPVAFPNIYNDDIEDVGDESDNVLCIDTVTENFTGSYVYAIPASNPTTNPYQITFFGDYIVAQMVAAINFVIEEACKDDICRYVPTESGVDQEGSPIPATGIFDFGSYLPGVCDLTQDRWTSAGYCDLYASGDANTYGNGIMIYREGDTFDNGDQYRISMTVRVGATADPTEVVFNNLGTNSFWTTSNEQGNCSCSTTSVVANNTGVGWVWTDGTATSMYADFTVTAAETGFGAILLDLAAATVDLDNVSPGQRVYLDVTLYKLPCGIVQSATICLSELIAACPSLTTATVAIDGIAFIGDRVLEHVLHGYLGRLPGLVPGATLTYPYVPAINDPGFFTGFVVNNVGGSDVTLTITITDNVGGTATASMTLSSGLQMVNTLENLTLVDGSPALNRDLSGYVTVTAVAAP